MFDIKLLILFTIIQLINVIVSTIKYIATIKASPAVAAIINAASYTIGAIITYFIGKQAIVPVIIVTFCMNLLGVPIGRFIVDKCSKDRLWVFDATVKCTEKDILAMKKNLKENFAIQSVFSEIVKDEMYEMRCFSYSKADSRQIITNLDMYKSKYHIIEPR